MGAGHAHAGARSPEVRRNGPHVEVPLDRIAWCGVLLRRVAFFAERAERVVALVAYVTDC